MSIPEFSRHPNLYFESGDIALSASSGINSVLVLRIHRFMLSHHSSVFSDMFSLPDHPQAQGLYDGVPLVRVPDPAEDLSKLIDALYNPQSLSLVLPRNRPAPLKNISKTLRLAVKYDVESVRSRIITHLEAEWPRNLQEWYEFHCALKAKQGWESMTPLYPDDVAAHACFQEPVAALYLAREFNITSILPAVFYRLSTTKISDDTAEDSTSFDSGSTPADWGNLLGPEWRLMMRGRNMLIHRFQMLMSDTYDFFNHGPPTNCTSPLQCEDILQTLRNEHVGQFDPSFARRSDIIGNILDWLGCEDDTWGLCFGCEKRVRDELRRQLASVWENLPIVFELRR